uniref:Uncharacterized protein n=1 Tax=Plectus sambesii TaxID=2011161 RepID=A0A914WYZ4_9BILA
MHIKGRDTWLAVHIIARVTPQEEVRTGGGSAADRQARRRPHWMVAASSSGRLHFRAPKFYRSNQTAHRSTVGGGIRRHRPAASDCVDRATARAREGEGSDDGDTEHEQRPLMEVDVHVRIPLV